MNKKRKSKGKCNTKAFFPVDDDVSPSVSKKKNRHISSLGNFSEIYYVLIFLNYDPFTHFLGVRQLEYQSQIFVL